MTDRCQIPRCSAEAAVTYLGHGICSDHWNQLTSENAPPDVLKVVLGIAAEPDQENRHMPKKKTEPEQITPTETPKANIVPPATPEKKTKPPKTPKTQNAAKPEKPKREPKPKPKPKEELCVFALRLTPAERDALHAMAGPARASRFARTVLAAAAQGDESAFKAAIKEAREARS